MSELPIVQKTYDLIRWYIPILNRLPRDHRFALGDRIVNNLYDLLEELIRARYSKNDKLTRLGVRPRYVRNSARSTYNPY